MIGVFIQAHSTSPLKSGAVRQNVGPVRAWLLPHSHVGERHCQTSDQRCIYGGSRHAWYGLVIQLANRVEVPAWEKCAAASNALPVRIWRWQIMMRLFH